MERSRSKRNHYYDQDYESQTLARKKPRYHHYNNNNNNNNNSQHRRGGVGGRGRLSKPQDTSGTVSTSYRILCHDIKAGGVIGKSGNIIKAIRQDTGAWINVHQLIPGDEERLIEITDVQHRDLDGRVLSYSPAQEALFMIHDRILESDVGFGFDGGDDDEDYDPHGSGIRVATRLVVAKANVGSLLGKGGKIIEQMRMETKTHIRILPRDHNLPQCVSMSEEIVQVVGHMDAVKKAIAIISSRLRESQFRDRSHFQGRLHSPEQFFPRDDFAPHMSNMQRLSNGPTLGPRASAGWTSRNNASVSRPSDYAFESGFTSMANHVQPFSAEDLVFQILCPNDKVDRVMGETHGIIKLLRGDIGVDVRVMDPEPGSDEQIIIVSSNEGPDDDLFPAQEALLHIQSQIVDLGPDKDNIITTRLLVPSSEIGCLDVQDGSLSEMRRLTGANIQILPREDFPLDTLGANELVQIVGEIRAAREALVELTSRLRNYMYREIEAGSPNRDPTHEDCKGSDSAAAGYANMQTETTAQPPKVVVMDREAGASRSGSMDWRESNDHEGSNRLSVTRSTLEVVIPEHAIPKLIMGSGNILARISELSGANVNLDKDRSELTKKIIQISGTPEQAERAQSLLQGFILSIQEDAPLS